jgi:hypothetical protein
MLKPLCKIRQGNLERHCDVFQHGTRSAKCRVLQVLESRAGSKYLLTLKALVFKLDLGEVPMKPVRIAVLLSAGFALGAITASAQPVIGAKSGVVNVAEGKVYLADQLLELAPTQFPDIKENVVLRTEEGRAEVLLTPGVFLRVWENSSFKMISNRLIDTRIELLSGSAIIEADEIAKDTALTIICKDATVTLSKVGLYRFDTQPAQLRVFAKGPAEVSVGGQSYSVGQGKLITLGGTLAVVEKFNTETTDSLDHWSRRRGEVVAQANVSAANRANTSIGINPCSSIYQTGPVYRQQLGNWGYNPYYGLITYIPCGGNIYSPYGYRLWSPSGIYRAFYAPQPTYNGGGFGGYNSMPNYPTMGATSGGYSGAMSSGNSGVSSAPAAASSGSSAAASSGTASVGSGSGGGGGRGH